MVFPSPSRDLLKTPPLLLSHLLCLMSPTRTKPFSHSHHTQQCDLEGHVFLTTLNPIGHITLRHNVPLCNLSTTMNYVTTRVVNQNNKRCHLTHLLVNIQTITRLLGYSFGISKQLFKSNNSRLHFADARRVYSGTSSRLLLTFLFI